MMSHTPGPWKVMNNGHYFEVRASGTPGSKDIDECSPSVASVFRDIYYPHTVDAQEANAQLIAAVPDLLAACEEFVRKCERGEAKSKRSYAQMKAAIAKAKGYSKCRPK